MLRKLFRSKPLRRAAGRVMAGYLKLVRRTNRFVVEPAEAEASHYALQPVIVAMWHGQHFMVAFARRPQDELAVIVSRHGDGEVIAATAKSFGIRAVRGSGSQRPDQIRRRGGSEALRGSLAALKSGATLALTADVPKISRVAGRGIVTIAQLSGRPVVPLAVVTSRRLDFRNWDRSSVGLPFGRGAIVFGEPIHVARDASPAALEEARLAIEHALDDIHVRAYAMVGATDPGAGRPEVEAARRAAAAFGGQPPTDAEA
jgi:lysophospholipid acyltransferase (LPLAT)-like uncharacterized protein